ENKKGVSSEAPFYVGGRWRIRTAVHGFADRCLTPRPTDHGSAKIDKVLFPRKEKPYKGAFFSFSRVRLTHFIWSPIGGFFILTFILSKVNVVNLLNKLSIKIPFTYFGNFKFTIITYFT